VKPIALILILVSLLCVLSSACQAQKGEQSSTAYQIYFPTKSERFGSAALVSELHYGKAGKDEIPELLRLLLEGPKSQELSSLIPSGVSVRDWSLKDGVLTVDFSSNYGLLSGIDLTLADYSVTITLSQIPEVKSVVTTVEGDRITYRDRQNLQKGDVFLSIYRSDPVEREVTLLFPRKDQKDLGEETRSISLMEDQSLAIAVLSALAEGPDSDELTGVLSKTDILSADVRDGICYLNLAATFQTLAPEEEKADRLILYALVNTLCELDNISSVRFLTDGAVMERYGTVELKEPLKALSSLSE
jgi:germination protein M